MIDTQRVSVSVCRDPDHSYHRSRRPGSAFASYKSKQVGKMMFTLIKRMYRLLTLAAVSYSQKAYR